MKILRMREVTVRVGLGRTAIYAAMRRGDFPRSIQLTKKAVGWDEGEIEAWLAARATERAA